MATYVAESGSFTQTEVHLYGSSRLGVLNCAVNCGSLVPTAESVLERGNKFFELSNHLGNVLVTVTDRLVPHSTDGTSIAYNAADVSSAQDYYSFGMAMPGRGFSSGSYRYGFNGKENDNEVKGQGNQVDFGARIYDPRLGRWLSTDPDKRGWYNPYQSFGNNPVLFKDPDGRWQTDGHYWTMYLLATLLQIPNAERIAHYTEYPDTYIHGNIAEERYTWANGSEQTRTHSLTGLDHTYDRAYTIKTLLNTSISDVKEFGRLLHRLGDNYAHRDLSNPEKMYGNLNGYTTEHLTVDGSAPDFIYNRIETGDYMNYAKDVLFVLSLSTDTKVKYTDALDKAEPILNGLMAYAKENKVSLMGIINYEVAKLQGSKEFYIHSPISLLSTDYKTYLENTRKYLNSKGVKFTEEKTFMTETFDMSDGSGTYDIQTEVGTKFTVN